MMDNKIAALIANIERDMETFGNMLETPTLRKWVAHQEIARGSLLKYIEELKSHRALLAQAMQAGQITVEQRDAGDQAIRLLTAEIESYTDAAHTPGYVDLASKQQEAYVDMLASLRARDGTREMDVVERGVAELSCEVASHMVSMASLLSKLAYGMYATGVVKTEAVAECMGEVKTLRTAAKRAWGHLEEYVVTLQAG